MRTIPTRPEPRTDLGESFSGYLDRLAARAEVPLLTMLARTGLVDKEHHLALPVGYGVALPAERLKAFSRITRIPQETVSEMLLLRYDGVACNFSDLDATDRHSFRRMALREWAYFIGSHVCSDCLVESGGVWRLAWKLPWSFACTRHRTLLVDTCPGCDKRVGAGRTDGRSAPAFPTRIPNPVLCRNALAKGQSAKGRAAVPCRHPFHDVDAPPLDAWPRLLTAQNHIDRALAGKPCSVGGEDITSLEYFSDLRSIVAFILSWGMSEDLGETPQIVREAFICHVQERNMTRELRADGMAAGEDGRNGPRSRHYTGPPHDSALMAAIIPLAVSILDAGSREMLSHRLEPLVHRLHDRDRRFRHRLKYFGFSPRLEGAVDRCLEPYQKMVHRVGLGSKSSTEAAHNISNNIVTSDHVPQLLWEEEYQRSFSGMVPDVRDINARLFCSLALVKMVEGLTWKEAAEELGLSDGWHHSLGNRSVILLNRAGNADLFAERLRGVAGRLADKPDKVNYGLRRRWFADLTDIAPEDWRSICAMSGVSPGKRGGRSQYAAVWVWCYLTGGDHRLAPGLQEGRQESRREVYRRFVKYDLPRLKNHLAEYSELLLERCEDDSDGGREVEAVGGR